MRQADRRTIFTAATRALRALLISLIGCGGVPVAEDLTYNMSSYFPCDAGSVGTFEVFLSASSTTPGTTYDLQLAPLEMPAPTEELVILAASSSSGNYTVEADSETEVNQPITAQPLSAQQLATYNEIVITQAVNNANVMASTSPANTCMIVPPQDGYVTPPSGLYQ